MEVNHVVVNHVVVETGNMEKGKYRLTRGIGV